MRSFTRTAVERVVAKPTLQHIVIRVAEHLVVAASAKPYRRRSPAVDRIAGAVAREHVGEIRSDQLLDVGLHIAVAARRRGAGTEIGIDRRSCRRIVGEVRARAAVHRIAAGTAVERIVAAAAVDLVDAGAAGHGVMPLPARKFSTLTIVPAAAPTFPVPAPRSMIIAAASEEKSAVSVSHRRRDVRRPSTRRC